MSDLEFNNKKDKIIKDKVLEKSKKLSSKDKDKIIYLVELKKRQESEDNPEILPKVTKEDIPLYRNYAVPEVAKDGVVNVLLQR